MTTVVLVDDQALLRTGLRIVVDSEDDLAIVGEASDGQEAIELAERLQPDVVLMDVRMPGTDGIAATGRITATTRSRVIILTTFDLDEYVYDGLRAGASGFLLKDAAPETLVDAIRTVALGDAVLAPAVTRRVVEQFASTTRAAREATATPGFLVALTEREREVFLLVARGLSNRELAAELFLSEHTVKVHVARILAKLDLRDRIQAVVLAYESGLIRPGTED